MKFIQTCNDVSNLSSPYLRKSFNISEIKGQYELKIVVAGLYVLYVNGTRVSDYLMPCRTNPEQCCFIDTFDITKYLNVGENVIALILGNGIVNSQVSVWKMDVDCYNPKLALELFNDKTLLFDATSFKWHESEVIYNEYHKGEQIDANKLLSGWNNVGFDDKNWKSIIFTETPKGKIITSSYEKVKCYETLKPVEVIKGSSGYIYDFGKSVSGIYELTLKGKKNKEIFVFANDALEHGKKVYTRNITSWWFENPKDYNCDKLILSGNLDHFEPRFTYKGCRFIELNGLTDEEAKTVEIKLHAISSLAKTNGTFKCDNDIVNGLQQLVLNSDLANFIYYPTDCPHREKNGWTGDAGISAEQMLLNFDCKDQFKNWLKQIVYAQLDNGTLPCICPLKGWGYDWGTGPGWDIAIFEIAYRVYVYTGDKEILSIVSPALVKYISYMKTKELSNGLFDYGLEDWLPINSKTKTEVTDTMFCFTICDLGTKIFYILNDNKNRVICEDYKNKIKDSFLKRYPLETGNLDYTQTWLSMALYMGLYEDKERVLRILKTKIDFAGGHLDVGLFGTKYLFRALGEVGETELALKLIIQDSFPSYKTCFLDPGFTTLTENFMPKGINVKDLDYDSYIWCASFNHHMFGDISSFFYRYIAGIKIDDVNLVNFSPNFVKQINNVEATHVFECGELKVRYQKEGKTINVELNIPNGITVNLNDIKGYACSINKLQPGINKFTYKEI